VATEEGAIMATIIAPIANYRSDTAIPIEEHLRIEPIPQHVIGLMANAFNQRLIRHPTEYRYCIVYSDFDKTTDKSRELMERLITALRLFKPGNVFYNYALIDETHWYESPGGRDMIPLEQFAIFPFFGWSANGLVDYYEVSDKEVPILSQFVAKHWKTSLIHARAYKYFFKAYHEFYADHRFLDYTIALENVLANDENEISNIRYKFVDRGCFLLKRWLEPTESIDGISRTLKQIYDVRCEIVHSTKKERDWGEPKSTQLLKKTDLYVRTLLRNLLNEAKLAKASNVDAEKRSLYSPNQD
jgi:hypothetical protein